MTITLPALGAATGEPDHSSDVPSRDSLPSTPTPDFIISATSATAVNVNQSADSTIIINAVNSFVGSVAITGNPSYGLTCGSITPPEVSGSGVATVSCSATTAGEYDLTLTGVSGSLTHKTNATFNFVDFKIEAWSPTGAVSVPLISTVSIVALNGFTGTVTISTTAQIGLACGLITPSTLMGSGMATVSCSATSIGIYILTVHGTSSSLTHSINATFDVAVLPDFSIDVTSPTTGNAGQPATSTITIKDLNAFTGAVALTDTIPPNLTCQTIMPTTVLGSGTATVSCNSNTAGIYPLTIMGTSNTLSHSTTATFDFVDFTMTARSPPTSNVGSSASTNVIIGSLNGFVGTVSLTDTAPSGLSCDAISPNNVLNSGTVAIFCNATIAGTYVLTVTGTIGPLTHSVTATFAFTGTASPDFVIAATLSVSFTSGSAGTSMVSISGLNNFYDHVTLSYQISPINGLTVAFNPATLYPGASTATFSSSTPGSYTVTITGTHGSQSHTAMVHVTVTTPVVGGAPDVTLATSVSFLSFNSGASGAVTITVTPQNDFIGTITLAVAAPASVSCSLTSTTIQSSGTSTLACSGSAAGDFTVMITATGGAIPHTTTVNVDVDAISPAAPAPSRTLGLSTAVFYGIIGVIIIVVVSGTVLVLRGSRRSAS